MAGAPLSDRGDWPCLPRHGGDVQWDVPDAAMSCRAVSKATALVQKKQR
jgi:hypothetical protein